MNNKEKAVFIFAEQVDNHITPVSFELLGKARELAEQLDTQVVAILLGFEVANLTDELIAYGAQSVIIGDHIELE